MQDPKSKRPKSDRNDPEETPWWMQRGGWLGAGIAIGVAVGVALDNIPIGIAIGIILGAGLSARRR